MRDVCRILEHSSKFGRIRRATRTCLLTGRNHHFNTMSSITEGATGFPGSNGMIPFENGFLSEMLLQHGYNTYAIGKWHLTPAHETSAAGPYDRWPLGRGFQRYLWISRRRHAPILSRTRL